MMHDTYEQALKMVKFTCFGVIDDIITVKEHCYTHWKNLTKQHGNITGYFHIISQNMAKNASLCI